MGYCSRVRRVLLSERSTTCNLVIIHFILQASVSVDVLVKPTINRDNIDMNPRVSSNRTLSLVCDASGKPEPKVSQNLNLSDQSINSGELVRPTTQQRSGRLLDG